MMRTILDGIQSPVWPLARELSLLGSLFKLYQVRDHERFVLVADTPELAPGVVVPPMLLLPLFENAITHGPSAGHAGPVELHVKDFGDKVRIEIRNPGPFRGRRPGGQGIAIAERRLSLAYGAEASLDVRADGEFTVVRVSLPRTPSVEEKLP